MELTGRCKKEFEKWLDVENMPNKDTIIGNKGESCYHVYSVYIIYTLPNPMKYSVMVDFFDTVGIYISDWREYHSGCYWYDLYEDTDGCKYEASDVFETKSQARHYCIKKANEIYNKRK